MKHTHIITTRLTTSAVLALVLLAGVAAATVTSDYFEYGDTNGTLVGLTTANTAGWGANGWSGSTNPKYWLTNVGFFSKHGEANSYVNTNVGGRLRGIDTAGTVTRTFSPALDGTVWVSMAVTCTFWNAALDMMYSRFLINNSASNLFGVGSYGFLNRIFWRVDENGVSVTNSIIAAGFNGNGGCLVVARLRTNYSGTYDDIALWVFTNNCDKLATRNVAGLGDALYESSTAQDIWGDSISSLGIAIKSSLTGMGREIWVDNLRISSGTITDDEHVYEILTGVTIPEPGAVMLGLAGLLGLVRRSRR